MSSFNRQRLKMVLSFFATLTLLSVGFQNCAKFDAGAGGMGVGFGSQSSVLPGSGGTNAEMPGPLTPDVATISAGGTLQISQSHDSGSGAFAVVAGSGTVDQNGVFTPSGNNTDAIIGRPDVDGNWSYTFVKVAAVGAPMALSPTGALIAPGQQVKFSAAAGTPPYVYTISPSHASIDAATGLLTAGAVEETIVVTVTDSAGKIAQSDVRIKEGVVSMAVLHAPNPMIVGRDATFVVIGGTAPYTLELTGGSGTVNGRTYTPGLDPENASFKITDSQGQEIELVREVIDDPASPVVAGTTTFSAPGTYTFTVPNFHSLSATVRGAGGGGGGTGYTQFVFGHAGAAGATTSFGTLIARGGGGGAGGGWYGVCGAAGAKGAASGSSTVVTGGGSAGGGAGGWGYGDCGGAGGAGGRVDETYSRATLTPGTTITIVIGTGGAGGAAGSGSGGGTKGSNGSVVITVM